MGQLTKSLAAPVEFDYQEKTWRLGPCTYKVQKYFEAYLEKNAMATAMKQKTVLDAEDYRNLVMDTRREIDRGYYTFGQEAVGEALRALPHYQYFVWLLFSVENHPGMQMDWVKAWMEEEPEQAADVFQRCLENSFPNSKKPPTVAAESTPLLTPVVAA